MTKIPQEQINETIHAFRKKKIFTVQDVVSRLGYSIPAVRLKLKQWQAHTSYNHSGQYYALPGVPHFDPNGLWWFKGAYFSKFGTLKDTVIHLVGASLSGLNGEQVGALVGLNPRSFLHHFRDTTGIRREKHQGVYVYFSDEKDRFEAQRGARLEAVEKDVGISDADAVVILVALINHYGIDPQTLSLLPQVRARGISAAAIARFCERHGFKKKPRSKR
jgi:hypothetical protein